MIVKASFVAGRCYFDKKRRIVIEDFTDTITLSLTSDMEKQLFEILEEHLESDASSK